MQWHISIFVGSFVEVEVNAEKKISINNSKLFYRVGSFPIFPRAWIVWPSLNASLILVLNGRWYSFSPTNKR